MSEACKDIIRLVKYGIKNNLIEQEDFDYAVNQLCFLLKVDFVAVEIDDLLHHVTEPSSLLLPILERAAKHELFTPDTTLNRDRFEAKIMDIIMKKPSTINKEFYSNYDLSPEIATENYYKMSKRSNYIKTSRTNKNIRWKSQTKYGVLDMTINLSKPEKDPRDIIAQGKKSSNEYPKCLLCKEHVGNYSGPGRSNHRIIPLKLNEEDFYLQYSPYVYYNEHCIVLMKEHVPMDVTINTFKRLFDFVDQRMCR